MSSPKRRRGGARPKRLTGVSIYGLQWEYGEAERDVVSDLIVFLEARRVLVVPYEFEVMDQVLPSVLEIRDAMTEALQRLPEQAPSRPLLNEMREVVLRFLIAVGQQQWVTPPVASNLGELRGIFYVNVRILAETFGFEVSGALGEAIAGW
jgi:hypothetical protein